MYVFEWPLIEGYFLILNFSRSNLRDQTCLKNQENRFQTELSKVMQAANIFQTGNV